MVHPSISGSSRFVRRTLAAVLLGMLGAPPAAWGHEARLPISGDSVLVQPDAFTFSTHGQAGIALDHSPASDESGLVVEGVGVDAGRTPFIPLDRNQWEITADGYRYPADAGPTRGGIERIELRNGSIEIQGGGADWPWSPDAPLDALWVHFRLEDEWYCAEFPAARASVNQAGHFEASGAAAPGSCPLQVCGNAVHESGEECDDGNLVEGDGCDNDCTVGECSAAEFASTFDAIQSVIFDSETYGCTNALCHGSAKQGGLDLRAGASYDSLLNGPASVGALARVTPAEPEQSLLYLKLLAKTAPEQLAGLELGPIGTPMPNVGPALTDPHLQALRLWIRGGAPRDRVVEGTGASLASCLPDPDPLKVPPVVPPAAGTGAQLRQPPWDLFAEFENEICMSVYYDFTDVVPEQDQVDCPPRYAFRAGQCRGSGIACAHDQDCPVDAGTGKRGPCEGVRNLLNQGSRCFAYHRLKLVQDAQSHHSVLFHYTGGFDTDAEGWGPWTTKLEDHEDPRHGSSCDPKQIDPALGVNPGCSGEAIESVACIFTYGPPDFNNFGFGGGGEGGAQQLLIAQETFTDLEYADGVHNLAPLKGVFVWNSHAFNLTQKDSTLAQYLNFYFAEEDDMEHAVQPLFDVESIFAQDVPPFETREYCRTWTAPEGSSLFQLTSHTHLRGTLFRVWAPPNQPCEPACANTPAGNLLCANLDAEQRLPECEGPRSDPPIYRSTVYNDPLNLEFDPPLSHAGLGVEDRTYLYCAVYDNGSTPESPPVKRQSTSPLPPLGALGALLGGGPCSNDLVACYNEGPQRGMLCGGDDTVCDSQAGLGDGVCDACPARGGVTTEDEMFILLGQYFGGVPAPEPSARALRIAAVAALGLLGARGWRARREH